MPIAIKYVVLAVLCFATLKGYLWIADKFNIIDKPNERSSHARITVRGGGIIFPLILFAWFLLNDYQYPFFFLGLLIISTISFLDDIFQLSSLLRFLIQLISVILLLFQLQLAGSPILILIVLIIFLVGILNVYNFMDGINGITASYSLSVLIGLWLVNNYQVQFIPNSYIYYIGTGICVFSFFNFRKKAICFAGDVGSVSISFILIFLLGTLIVKTHNILYLFFLSIYGVDSILTILHRLRLKENIFKAHRKHLYQLLANEMRYSHLSISIIYSIAQLLICYIVYSTIKRTNDLSAEFLVGLAIISFLILLFLFARDLINRRIEKIND